MFRESISSTPFYGDIANTMFSNITASKFNSDVSFESTARAILHSRIPEGSSVSIQLYNVNIDDTTRTGSQWLSYFENEVHNFNSIPGDGLHIINLKGNADKHKDIIEEINTSFVAEKEGYIRNEKFTALYKKSFATSCFVNRDRKATVLFVDGIDYRRWHYLQVSMIALFPWYFTAENPVTDLEKELIYSLRETTKDKYVELINGRISEGFDFREAFIKSKLTSFESRFARQEISNLENNVRQFNRNIDNWYQQIQRELSKLDDVNIKLLGLKHFAEGQEKTSELMEYFIANKSLFLSEVDDRRLSFIVKTYIEYFDKDYAVRLVDNKDSFMYRGLTRDSAKEKATKLLHEIFVSDEPRLRIVTCAGFRLTIGESVNGIGNCTYPEAIGDAIPNWHIHKHECLSGYITPIVDFIRKSDYVGATEQCIASAKSLNMTDTTVCSGFFGAFWDNGYGRSKCIELPDGSIVTPREGIEWLEQEEKKSKTRKEK